MIGSQPEPEAVIAWGIAAGVAHYFVDRWIDNSDWPDGVKIALHSLDLTNKGAVIVSNHRKGVRAWGDNGGPCKPAGLTSSNGPEAWQFTQPTLITTAQWRQL